MRIIKIVDRRSSDVFHIHASKGAYEVLCGKRLKEPYMLATDGFKECKECRQILRQKEELKGEVKEYE